MKFSELNLNNEIVEAVEKQGYTEATDIQRLSIPVILEGRDVIGQAQTGTGKTAAFALPMLEKIDPNATDIQVLIISPTRELAIQIKEEFQKLSAGSKLKSQVVYGGSDIRRQIQDLKRKPQIVIGTPGRVLDHIKRRTLKLQNVKTLILDEADEMLNMGFLEDIIKIIEATPKERQTLMFSATMPDDIKKIGVKFMKEPEHVKVKAKTVTTDLIDQYVVNTTEGDKFDTLTKLLNSQSPSLSIVFGRTKRRVDELIRALQLRGYRANGIHGDLSQQTRMRTLKQFKSGELDILVATDVAARGLDISNVSHVYNYDIPQEAESYVHRIGRTGRAGKHGTSVTFVDRNEIDYFKDIEKLTKKQMEPLKAPSWSEAKDAKLSNAVIQIRKEQKNIPATDAMKNSVSKLLEQFSAEEIAAMLIHNVADTSKMERTVEITREKPLPRKKGGNRYGSSRGNNSRGGSRGGSRNGGGRGRNFSSSNGRSNSGGGSDRRRGGSPKNFGKPFKQRSKNN